MFQRRLLQPAAAETGPIPEERNEKWTVGNDLIEEIVKDSLEGLKESYITRHNLLKAEGVDPGFDTAEEYSTAQVEALKVTGLEDQLKKKFRRSLEKKNVDEKAKKAEQTGKADSGMSRIQLALLIVSILAAFMVVIVFAVEMLELEVSVGPGIQTLLKRIALALARTEERFAKMFRPGS